MKKLEEIPQEEWDTCIMCALTECNPDEWGAQDTATVITEIRVPHIVQEKLKQLGKKWQVNQSELEYTIFSSLVAGGVQLKALEFHENQIRMGTSIIGNEIPKKHEEEICLNETREYCKFVCHVGKKLKICIRDTPMEKIIATSVEKKAHCKGIKHYGETDCQNEEASGET